VNADRAGVDTLRNVEFVHQLEDVAAPLDVHAPSYLGLLRTRANVEPGAGVEHAVDALHRPAHALLVREVTLDDRHGLREVSRVRSGRVNATMSWPSDTSCSTR
jgi:hypothetical protein